MLLCLRKKKGKKKKSQLKFHENYSSLERSLSTFNGILKGNNMLNFNIKNKDNGILCFQNGYKRR